MTLTSPIDGQVLTWDVQQLLESRARAARTSAADGGRSGRSLAIGVALPGRSCRLRPGCRRQAADDPLQVDFLLATDPGPKYQGRIEKTALAAQSDEIYGPHVLVTVAIDRDAVGGLRPGATVIGKIHCGRRALGFVWFHDLISMIRRRLLF